MSTKMQQNQIEWRRAKVMELLSKGETNQSDDAIRFVSGRSKEKIRSSSDSNEDGSKKESNEPACGEDEELEEKQEEKEVGETVATINQVF